MEQGAVVRGPRHDRAAIWSETGCPGPRERRGLDCVVRPRGGDDFRLHPAIRIGHGDGAKLRDDLS